MVSQAMKEAQKRYYEKNKLKILERQRKYDKGYYETHKDEFKLYYNNRCLLKREQTKLSSILNC